MNTLDRSALQQGGAVALVFAIPFAIAAQIAADGDGSPWSAVWFFGAVAGFVLGAGVAAWTQEKGFPLLHGMVCAGGTYLVAQAVFIVIKLFRDGDVKWISAFFTFTIVLFAGLIGGFLGSVLRRRGILPTRRNRS